MPIDKPAPQDSEAKAEAGAQRMQTTASPDDSALEAKKEGEKAVEKGAVRFKLKDAFPDEDNRDISEISLAELSKMKKEDLRELVLKGTSEGGIYRVDFEGNKKAEAKIGLQDIFSEENPLLIVQKNPDEDAFYAERGNDGLYYEPGTNKRVIIKTGYEVRVPGDEDQLAAFKEEAAQDRMANIQKTKRNESIAKRRAQKPEDSLMAAKEKDTNFPMKLLAFLNNNHYYDKLSEDQNSTLAKGMLSFKSNFDVDRPKDKSLLLRVSKYFLQNPSLSEKNVQTLANYEDVDSKEGGKLAYLVKKEKPDFNLTNPAHLDWLATTLEGEEIWKDLSSKEPKVEKAEPAVSVKDPKAPDIDYQEYVTRANQVASSSKEIPQDDKNTPPKDNNSEIFAMNMNK